MSHTVDNLYDEALGLQVAADCPAAMTGLGRTCCHRVLLALHSTVLHG